jgi:virginiamycin B lyase
MYNPTTSQWREWDLPGPNPQPYAVYVDEDDLVWLTDFGANAIHRFDPETERWRTIEIPTPQAEVRQLLGRLDEVWGAESSTDKLIVIRTLRAGSSTP